MNYQRSFNYGKFFLTTVFLLTLAFLSSLVVPASGETDLHISIINADDNPVKNAQVFLDGSPVGYTEYDGSKLLEGLDSGKHLVVAKKQGLGRTSANLYLSDEDSLHLRLKISETMGVPPPVQFGFHPGDP
ncbi:hypothetical protein KGY64_06995, partial [Candidatus Bipolaricaulota bacterium]|nr:hypothetical protein [Candidatus Bipolaricaulota bacterium]